MTHEVFSRSVARSVVTLHDTYVTNLGVSDQLVNTTPITFNMVYWAPRALESASREVALTPII